MVSRADDAERRRLVPLAERVVARIATSRFSPSLSSVEPRMLPPMSLMSTTATSASPPRSAFRRWATSRGRSGPSTTALLYGGIVPLVGPSIARALSPAMR